MSEITPFELVKVMESGFQCIWDLNNEICFYNPYNPPIYFSLGDALTAVGLLFAVIQLISPIKKITLSIKGFKDKTLWTLVGVALISNLLAANIPQLQGLNIPHPFNYALIWESISFITFVILVIWFWFQASLYKNIFNESNYKKFFHTILREIADEKKGHLEASITILDSNLEKIIDVIKFNKKGKDGEYAKYASSLLDYVLSEKSVLEYIVSNRIDFLFQLLVLVKENNIPNKKIDFVITKIIQELYNNPNSYLYKQLDDYSGASLYASLYDEIFKEDKSFILEFDVLNKWHPYSVTEEILLNPEYIDVYLKSVKKVIEFDEFSDKRICHLISNALYELETFVQRANWSSKDPNKWQGSRVGGFLGHTFPELYRKAIATKKMNSSEFEYVVDSKKFRQNVSASYALALVDHLRVLASLDNRNSERAYALEATEEVMSLQEDDTFESVRQYFIEFVWRRIEENVVAGYFPAILRIYVEIMYWNGSELPKWREEERKRLIDYLYKELSPRIKEKEVMANYETLKEDVLLPNFIKFEKNKFWITNADGSKTELKP